MEQELFSQAVSVRRPRVLYVEGGADGGSKPLMETLKRADIVVETATSFPTSMPPGQAAEPAWDAVLLDNYPDHPLPDEEYAALDKYVYTGGGMIFIAGQDNAQLSEDSKTPLEKMLPVSGDLPPESLNRTALVLVLIGRSVWKERKIAFGIPRGARQHRNRSTD